MGMRINKYKRCEMPWKKEFEIMMPLDSPVKVEHFLFKDHGDLMKGGCLVGVSQKVITCHNYSTDALSHDLTGK